MSKLNKLNTKKQSETAYNEHAPMWRDHAKQHAAFAPFKSLDDFRNIGVGRAIILVANGASFEENIEVLKKKHHGHDIMCCDKTLGHLISHGIKPTYCLVADAKVSYETYMKPWEDQLDQTTLFMSVTANPKWSFNGNWRSKYFFANFDSLRSEREFMAISGCQNKVAAATNVSNAMVVFITQSDNHARRNFFGYDKILLLGYDYSWKPDGSYYAFDKSGRGKHNYMRHVYAVNRRAEMVYTSANLLFSAQWLENYLQIFKLPVVNCSTDGLLGKVPAKPLDEQLPYKFRDFDRAVVHSELKRRDELARELQSIERRVAEIGVKHWDNYIQTTL